jgi:hypothetical protein
MKASEFTDAQKAFSSKSGLTFDPYLRQPLYRNAHKLPYL